MSITGLAILFIIIWWIIFFSVLPIGVQSKKEKFKVKKDKFTNNIEGFQGCEFSGV